MHVFWIFVHCVLVLIFLFVLHSFLAIVVITTWHVTLLLALHCYCLVWCIVSHLALLLLIMVHHPCLVVLLFIAVSHLSPCATTNCCGVSSFTLHCWYLLWCITFTLQCALLLLFIVVCCPSPYVVICCSSLSFALHYCLCRSLSFALCYCYLLWCVVFTLHCYYLLWCIILCLMLLLIVVHHPHLALLLLFVVVRHPLPYVVVAYGASPSPCIVAIHCGLSFFALRCCFVVTCLFLIFTSPSLVLFLLFVVACLLKWCTSTPSCHVHVLELKVRGVVCFRKIR